MKAVANIQEQLYGKIFFDQDTIHDLLHIHGKVCGFTREDIGLHGFHVHTDNKIKGFCCGKGLKGHFNPFNTKHGDITDYPCPSKNLKTRHAGDLGNIKVVDKCPECNTYCSIIDIYDSVLSLFPQDIANIENRSIVIHQDEDDLGRGDNKESLINGNAGKRIGFGVIKYYK